MVDQAVKDKLEAGFAKLQGAADCKSLLKKYLTKPVLDELKDKKTAMGATLLDVVQSGELSTSDLSLQCKNSASTQHSTRLHRPDSSLSRRDLKRRWKSALVRDNYFLNHWN